MNYRNDLVDNKNAVINATGLTRKRHFLTNRKLLNMQLTIKANSLMRIQDLHDQKLSN